MSEDEGRAPVADLRIELCSETGRIRLYRETALRTYVETVERSRRLVERSLATRV